MAQTVWRARATRYRRRLADARESPAPVAADLEPSTGGSVEDVRIGWVKSWAAGRVAVKLCVVDHAPVVTAVFGDVGGAHVAV